MLLKFVFTFLLKTRHKSRHQSVMMEFPCTSQIIYISEVNDDYRRRKCKCESKKIKKRKRHHSSPSLSSDNKNELHAACVSSNSFKYHIVTICLAHFHIRLHSFLGWVKTFNRLFFPLLSSL